MRQQMAHVFQRAMPCLAPVFASPQHGEQMP
jgi:hypothetical protein